MIQDTGYNQGGSVGLWIHLLNTVMFWRILVTFEEYMQQYEHCFKVPDSVQVLNSCPLQHL
jgi:hypothetical protein